MSPQNENAAAGAASTDKAIKLLDRIGPPTDGNHKWLFYVAKRLKQARFSLEQALAAQGEIEYRMTRDSKDNEIEDAIRAAYDKERVTNTPRWPRVNAPAIDQVKKDGPNLSQLIACSPEPIRFDTPSRVNDYIDVSFPGNPLLCVGKSDEKFITRSREALRGVLPASALIVPSPMISRYGKRKKDGKLSAHSLDNTGPRRFLVVEFDGGQMDTHSAILWELKKYLPLVLVLFSGGKSLHGWLYCENIAEEKLEKFFRYAVSLGADKATWLRSQFVRLPDGCRHDQTNNRLAFLGVLPRRQAVLYFNPRVVGRGQQ